MVNARKAVGLVVALTVGGLMAAFLLPVVIGQLGGAEAATIALDTGNQTELQPGLNATLDSVDDTADSATYSVTADGDSSTVTVDNGTNSTVTVGGADVTIGVTSVSADAATAEFQSPTTYGWGGGAAALWGILPILIVLAVFLFFTYVAVREL